MRNGTFRWTESPISIVRHEGSSYVVDGHHRLAAAKLAGLSEVSITDVTAELTSSGFLGYKSMDDVLQGARTFIGNNLNRFKLR
jgi:hypothetical protein